MARWSAVCPPKDGSDASTPLDSCLQPLSMRSSSLSTSPCSATSWRARAMPSSVSPFIKGPTRDEGRSFDAPGDSGVLELFFLVFCFFFLARSLAPATSLMLYLREATLGENSLAPAGKDRPPSASDPVRKSRELSEGSHARGVASNGGGGGGGRVLSPAWASRLRGTTWEARGMGPSMGISRISPGSSSPASGLMVSQVPHDVPC
mmetsp:Transcript_11699/g.37153  ORF Transcript_11699/g.37153 Transcript_11699/m.37153 type:complete len:206 (+) Transcript_11699:1969-2586(+)